MVDPRADAQVGSVRTGWQKRSFLITRRSVRRWGATPLVSGAQNSLSKPELLETSEGGVSPGRRIDDGRGTLFHPTSAGEGATVFSLARRR